MPYSKELVFVRTEGMRGLTTLAVVQVECVRDLPTSDALSALEDSITEWVKATQEGHSLWLASCQDLNIGDLASHGTDGLGPYLRKNGILDIAFLYLGGMDVVIPFDRVLSRDPGC